MSTDYSTESDKIFDVYITLFQKIRERYLLSFTECDTLLQLKFILKIISQYADRSTNLENLITNLNDIFDNLFKNYERPTGSYQFLMHALRNSKLRQILKSILDSMNLSRKTDKFEELRSNINILYPKDEKKEFA